MRFIVALLITLSLSQLAYGQDILVVTEVWPPYNYHEGGEITGVSTEVVRATLDRTGYRYSIKVYPWARAYRMAQEQENVLIFTILKLPSRAELFKWIKIDGLSTNMFLFSPQARNDITLETLDDARKYRIGVTRDTATHHFLLANGFKDGVNLFPVSSEEQNTLKSDPSFRRIDLTTGDRLTLAWFLNKSGYPSDYWKEELLLLQEDFYMAFGRKTSDEVVGTVRRAYEQVRAEGVLEAIEAKYYSTYGKKQ